MQNLANIASHPEQDDIFYNANEILNLALRSFEHVAPTWSLKALIAVNPLKGLENMHFNQALAQAFSTYEQRHLHSAFHAINRESIKWCQAYFEAGQASIVMPLKEKRLYECFSKLARYDKQLVTEKHQLAFVKSLPNTPEAAIAHCFKLLGVSKNDGEKFTHFLLTSLPGWSSYVSYLAKWRDLSVIEQSNTLLDYLAVRTIITTLLWPRGENIKTSYQPKHESTADIHATQLQNKIIENEASHQKWLLSQIRTGLNKPLTDPTPQAQLVFCIDVRSEPIRRAIESTGNYETFGFAGFFGIPTTIKNEINDACYASCPVLIKPKHMIHEDVIHNQTEKSKLLSKRHYIRKLQKVYQNLKYTFTTPFTLVEGLGIFSGLWMLTKSINPKLATAINNHVFQLSLDSAPLSAKLMQNHSTNGISLSDQINYAENFLRSIGMTKTFAPIIILCAHGATTENNAYQSALECGACGGHNGSSNARILATILNNLTVKGYLKSRGIDIPAGTIFIAGLHNTTTGEIKLDNDRNSKDSSFLASIKSDLNTATARSNQERSLSLQTSDDQIRNRSIDWAEPRPEWGLAKNSTFIIGPRRLTKHCDFEGRAFLHSYDWEIDTDATLLNSIMTAPLVVAQWINSQYLFSTHDNVAYGAGSKITHNISGKIGIMQGNASDLMHGLPLQSVFSSDLSPYHELIRLNAIIYAPSERVKQIILTEPLLMKWVTNQWIHVICVDPQNHSILILQPDLSWLTSSTKSN